jgi:hypothetical protein
MKLLRLRIATALLCGAGFAAGVIAGPDLTLGPTPTHSKPGPAATRYHPAERILLASLTGLAICFVWIWINGRAWS